ncbi:hypothetical protein PV04_05050 [Phialophora macrospora]|uniref:Uncharacterized protein n=1 Tax=Phialophora macrospora TaxID=1851006 RepID=A0A0D2E472_9EURO|nr:hypothetical protein PV04_05050 [Phialophora macrospora]
MEEGQHESQHKSQTQATVEGQHEGQTQASDESQHESERSSHTSLHDDAEVPQPDASSDIAGDLNPVEEPAPEDTVVIQAGEPPTTSTETSTPTTGKKPAVVETIVERQPKRHSPLRQSAPAWGSACLAIGIYIPTVCYAFGSTGLRHLSFTALNPSNTLLVLRALSELTSLSLVLLIHLSTERALWLLIAQNGGTRLSSFLALCPGSGPWGWIKLLYINAGGARRLSWLKLVVVVVPPAMGIVLLSNVDVRLFFDDHANFPVSAGIGVFNASWAFVYAPVAATLMASDYSALLQTSAVSWSVPVVDLGRSECDVSNFFSNNTCGWGYFLHGGSQLITPWPTLNTTRPDAPIYTIHSIRGLQLDFTYLGPDASFQGEHDCIVLGRDNDAMQICLSQAGPNAVNAKFVVCPLTVADSACLDDTSWFSAPGWTITMRAYARHATVHLSRANLSAVAVSDFSTPTAYSLSAADMLSVYNTTLGVRSTLASQSPAEQFVSMLSNNLMFTAVSAPTAAQATLKLYNLLAIPLYYFQPTYISPYSNVPSPDRVLEGLPPEQGLYVTASLSTMYYGLAIATWSVCLYTAVMGTLLLCCLVLVTVGSLPKTANGIPNTSAWSFVDFVAECDVEERQNTTAGVVEVVEEMELEEVAGARNEGTNTIIGTGTGTGRDMLVATRRLRAAKSRRSRAEVLEQSIVQIHRNI